MSLRIHWQWHFGWHMPTYGRYGKVEGGGIIQFNRYWYVGNEWFISYNGQNLNIFRKNAFEGFIFWNPPYLSRQAPVTFNTSRPRQYGRNFPNDIFKSIYVNENVWISINFSLKCVPKIRINNIPAFGSDNDLAPTRRQAIIWTNDG